MRSIGRHAAASPLAAYSIVALALIALRVAAATRFPLGGDEAYYWEWSRRLAFGYVDHPPMVAWTIALFDGGVHNALRVRAGFILFGILASVATWDLVRNATGSTTRGLLAALAIAVTPLNLLAFNFASPDGPFLALWIATLAFALRAIRSGNMRWWILAGAALGFAALARVFAISLVPGIVWALTARADTERVPWRGPIVAAVVASLVAAPYVVWNAMHSWVGFEFALSHRHHLEAPSLLRFALTIAGALAAGALTLAPLVIRSLFIDAGIGATSRRLLLGSALPLAIVVAVLSLFEPVELYWFAGPMLSLVVLAFTVPVEWSGFRRWSFAGLAPLACLAVAVFLLACAPASLIVHAAKRLPSTISTASALEIYSDRPLAAAIRHQYRGSIVVTDEYGLSSLLDFYEGIPPYVIGYNSEGREALKWLKTPRVKDTIYLDHIELARRADMRRLLLAACGSLRPLPGIAVTQERFVIHRFSLTRCEEFNGRSVAILNRTF